MGVVVVVVVDGWLIVGGCGRHYVAFVRKNLGEGEGGEDQWVLFNDEKVVRATNAEEMKK